MKAEQANAQPKAGRGGKRSTSWKKGQSGNPKGSSATVRAGARSLHWHVSQRFNDDDRAQAIDAQIVRARAGDDKALRILAELGGEGVQQAIAPTTVNVLALINAQPDLRAAAQRLFAALPLGTGDAGGLGSLLFEAGRNAEAGLDAVASPNADQ